jgi:hypothetical protein
MMHMRRLQLEILLKEGNLRKIIIMKESTSLFNMRGLKDIPARTEVSPLAYALPLLPPKPLPLRLRLHQKLG